MTKTKSVAETIAELERDDIECAIEEALDLINSDACDLTSFQLSDAAINTAERINEIAVSAYRSRRNDTPFDTDWFDKISSREALYWILHPDTDPFVDLRYPKNGQLLLGVTPADYLRRQQRLIAVCEAERARKTA